MKLNSGVKHSTEGIDKLFSRSKTLKEAFLYNYEKQIWTRYTRQDDGEIKSEESDFSLLLNLHLNDLAKVGDTFEDVLKLY